MFKGFRFNNLSRQKLTATTVLGEYGNQKITVSQMLTAAESCAKFIKDHFNVNENPYSLAVIVLKLLKLRLNNQNTEKPTKEQLKCLVDVFHEIEDMKAQTDIEKRNNETIANEFKMIIDFLDKLQKESPK